MKLEQILQKVESRIVRAEHALLKPDRLEELRDEAERRSDELRDLHEAFDRCKAERHALQQCICGSKIAIRNFTAEIQTCLRGGDGDQAFRLALQLDEVRKELAAFQAGLPRLEQICWSREYQIRYRERQLARIHEQIYPA